MTPRPILSGDGNVSVDIDALRFYREIHGIPNLSANAVDPLWTLGVPRAQKLFAEFSLPATFFVVGADLWVTAHREVAHSLLEDGHELANHSQDHFYDLRRRPPAEIRDQIRQCDEAIAELAGAPPVGFRTPGYNASAEILEASRAAGHRYDASLFPAAGYWLAKAAVMGYRRFRRSPSHSDRAELRTLLASTEPYYCDPQRYWRPSPEVGDFVEFPVAAVAGFLPIIGTSLHLLRHLGWDRLWARLHRRFPRFFNLEFHAIDFVDAEDLRFTQGHELLTLRQPDLRVPWSQKEALYRQVLASLCRDREMVTLGQLLE